MVNSQKQNSTVMDNLKVLILFKLVVSSETSVALLEDGVELQLDKY